MKFARRHTRRRERKGNAETFQARTPSPISTVVFIVMTYIFVSETCSTSRLVANDRSFVTKRKKLSVADVLQFERCKLAARQIAFRSQSCVLGRRVNLSTTNRSDEPGSISRCGDRCPLCRE